ncbi:MAG: FAD-binding oxidoreductase [Acidobacteriota bacterium]
MAKPVLSAQITHREDLNDTLAIFRFELEGGVPDFTPGQFVTLGIPHPDPEKEGKMLWRAYSIASAPSTKEHLELYIRWARKPIDGLFTTKLWEMKVGDTLKQRGITGPFTVEDSLGDGSPDQRRLLLFGGGTGVAPFLSYAIEMQRKKVPRELVVLHGASYIEELGYREELIEMDRQTADAGKDEFRLRYIASISRPKEEANAGWDGEVGRVETLIQKQDGQEQSRLEEILGEEVTRENSFCHVCGYGATCKAVEEVLKPRGFRTRREKGEDGTYDMKVESYG